ncbi:MAG: OmpA family protein [Burkholderiaceae bacterium]
MAAVMQRATTERQQAAERAVEAARQALANASVAAGAATPALADTNLPAASGQLSATGIESSGADSSQSVIARSTVTTPSTDFVQSSSDVPTRAAPAASLASAGAPNVADPTASAAAPTTGLAGSGPTAVGSTAEVPPVARAGETLTTGSLAALIDSMRRAERADRDRVAQARAETNRLIAQATSASDEHRRRVLGMIETPERVTSPEADGAPSIPPATSMVSDDARDDVPIPASDRSRPPASSDQVAPDLPQPVGRADQSVDTDPKGNRGPASVADLGTVGEPSFGSGISAENRERLAMVLAPDATLPAPAASREAREQEATIHDFLAGQVVEFQVGRDRLTKNGQRALDRLAELIQRQKDTHIVVQGHTDSVGDRASNLELSGARALVALDYLVSRGIDASRLSAQGFGETKPIASNRTADGRKRNRRIDFAVLEPR